MAGHRLYLPWQEMRAPELVACSKALAEPLLDKEEALSPAPSLARAPSPAPAQRPAPRPPTLRPAPRPAPRLAPPEQSSSVSMRDPWDTPQERGKI